MPKGGINGRKRNFGKLNTPMGDFDWLGAQSNYRVKYFAKIMQKVLKKLCKKDTVMHCTIIYTWTMPDMVKYRVALWHLALG